MKQTTLPASIEAVQLTAEETENVINAAKAEKFFRLRDEEKREEKKRMMQECVRPWNTAEMASFATNEANAIVSSTGKKFLLDDISSNVFALLSQYFSQNIAFEKNEAYSLSKGILLIGPVGIGKTAMLKAFRKNKSRCFLPVSANDIVRQIQEKGIQYWNTFTGYVPGHGSTPEYFLQPKIGWMIDDLGTEEQINTFGNKLDAMDKIIQQRYMLADHIPFNSLHMTTNLSEEMLLQRYGSRFVSRLYDMFNIIVLTGKDRRKLNNFK